MGKNLESSQGRKMCSVRKDKGEADGQIFTENTASKPTVDQP